MNGLCAIKINQFHILTSELFGSQGKWELWVSENIRNNVWIEVTFCFVPQQQKKMHAKVFQ